MKIKLELNEPKILSKVQSDKVGLLVAKEWKRLLNPYTPKDTGNLVQNVDYKPNQIHYKVPYAAYQYYGEVYVDPKTGRAGFLTDKGWKSRNGVKKVPSGRKLQYQKNNPYATDHWDEAAEKAGQKAKLYRTLNNALQSGNF